MRSIVIAVVLVTVGCQAEPNLSTSKSELISVSPVSSTSFPITQIGSTSSPLYFTVSPSGVGSNTISNVYSSCSEIQVQAALPGSTSKFCNNECNLGVNNLLQCPAQLVCQGGFEIETYQFSATFRPLVAATSSCTITIVSNNTVSINVSGTGAPPPLSGYVSPSTLNFGDVRVGTASGAGGFTIVNNGGQTLDISSLVAPAAYTIQGPRSFAIAAGGAQNVNLTCTPGMGQQGGSLSIGSTVPLGPIALSCNGIVGALDISPSPSAIPATRVGEPRTQTITLANSGTASMTIASVAFTGTDMQLMAMPPPNTVLAPGATATATIKFGASAAADATGTLTVTYDGGQSRATQISAKALSTSMSISPSGVIDLGPVCVGQRADKTFAIVANADGPFRVSSIASADAVFAVSAPGLPANVQGNAATTYSFDVAAAPVDAGPLTTQVTVTTDIPGAAPTTLDVAVMGLAEGVTGTPSELYLGAVPAVTNTVGQSIKITNCSTTSAVVTSPRIEGADATEFSIVVYPDDLTIPSSGNIEWIVIASPKTAGEKTATFVVDHGDTQVTIPLSADGIGEQSGGGGTEGLRPSYYACSVGGSATSAWPLVFAVGFVVVRRRRCA